MAGSKLSILLILLLVVGATASSSANLPAGEQPFHTCVFSYSARAIAPCAPFVHAGIKVLAAIPSSAFGRDTAPQDIAVLDDGTVMVRTDRNGLYRIADRRLQRVWRPNSPCGSPAHFGFELAGSFDDAVLLTVHDDRNGDASFAVRPDGSKAFQLPFSYASVAQDASGIIWLFKGGPSDRTIYAYDARTKLLSSVEVPSDIFSMFRSPNGHVYVTNVDGLYKLESQPTARALLVHAPILLTDIVARNMPVQAVGRDGSIWAANSVKVVHVSPYGTRREMLLVEPQNTVRMMHPADFAPMSLTMTPDGSVWNGGTVRIDSNDRIEVLGPPPSENWDKVRFGPDSSVWALVRDATGVSLGIVNVAPLTSTGRATASQLELPTPGPTSAPSFCPPPTPPPTPTPPLPPKAGPVDFVYVANAMSDDLWGYWVDKKGRLTQVHGSPFEDDHLTEVHLTIDPTGSHLYAGTMYYGIFAYTIDAQSGTLRRVPGSPFAAGMGPTMVAFDRSGRYAYGANLNGKTIVGYAVDLTTGALHQLDWSPLALHHSPFRIVMNPTRDLAYVVTEHDIETFEVGGNGALHRISTQALKLRGPSILLIERRARWAYLSNDYPETISTYGIDQRTGLLTLPTAPGVGVGSNVRAAATDPRAEFLYINGVPQSGKGPAIFGYRIGPKAGALRPLPTSPYAKAGLGNGITITPGGGFLYATNFASKSISGSSIDRTTGALWPLPGSPFKAGSTPDEIISCVREGDRCVTTP